MQPHNLQLYYPSAELSLHGDSLPFHTVVGDSSNTVNQFVWDGSIVVGLDPVYAVGWFAVNTTTPALRGHFFAVRASDGTTLTTVSPLPAVPADGDVFYLAAGMKFRSSHGVPLLKTNAYSPVVQALQLQKIKGVTVTDASSENDLYLKYDNALGVLQLTTDGTSWGDSSAIDLDVSGPTNIVGGFVQAPTGEWVVVNVTVASLPSVTTEEQVLITPMTGTLLPELWLDEADAVVHHFAVLRNGGEPSDIVNISLKCGHSLGATTLASDYTDGEETIVLDDASGLPSRDFWLYLNNSDADLRYVIKRAENVCYIADTSRWQEVPFSNGSSQPIIGQTISVGSASGVLRAVYITSGSWAGGDAAGLMVVSGSDGLFGAGDTMVQDSVVVAQVSAEGYYGVRGLPRKAVWGYGESVQWYPSYDVVSLAPDGSYQFNDVLGAKEILRVGALFSAWTPIANGYEAETLSNFGPGDEVGLVFRRFLLEELAGVLAAEDNLVLDWS